MKQGFSGNIGTLTPLLDENGYPKHNSGLLWTRIPLFNYKADENKPFIYTDKNGIQYMPDNHFETDGGSIPPACQIIPFAHLNPLNFPRAFLMHDGLYQYGGLYVKYPAETDFKFRLFDRKFADTSIADWLYYDDANWWTRRVICTGLAAGSWTVWGESKPKKQLEERKKENIDVYNVLGDLVEDNSGKKPTIQ